MSSAGPSSSPDVRMPTARELVCERVVIGAPAERLTTLAARLEASRAFHCVVLDAGQRLVGIIRLGDIARHSFAGNRILADLVSSTPPLVVKEDEPAADIAALFEQHRLQEAVVVSDRGTYVGLISAESIFEWLYREHRAARDEITALLAERERLSEVLEKKVEQRSGELHAAVDEFKNASLSLSHDVRAPLRAIQGYADLLLTGESGALNPDGVFQVQSIKRSASKLELLAEEILDKAKRAFAANSLQFESVDLNGVLDDAMDFHRSLLDARKAIVTRRGQLHAVVGRYVPVLQIATNLLGNAVKYVPDGRQPLIEIWTEESPGTVTLCIKDNGRGLAADERNRIFEPFVRIAVPGMHRSGIGLGLAITKSAVLEVGAHIAVESVQGSGSVFSVRFKRPDSALAVEPVSPGLDGSDRT